MGSILLAFILLSLLSSDDKNKRNDFPEDIDIAYDLYDFLDENYDEIMEREDNLYESDEYDEDESFLFTKKFLDDNDIYDGELFDWFMKHSLLSDSDVYFYLQDKIQR